MTIYVITAITDYGESCRVVAAFDSPEAATRFKAACDRWHKKHGAEWHSHKYTSFPPVQPKNKLDPNYTYGGDGVSYYIEEVPYNPADKLYRGTPERSSEP